MYRVNEIFLSIQGEGAFVGVPMVFVRLAGCNLRCVWCDTDNTSKVTMPAERIVAIVEQLTKGTQVCSVCITGGEPSLHELASLVQAVKARGFRVHMESNGTRALQERERPDWLTVSPKFPPGFEGLVQSSGKELKVPVTVDIPTDIDLMRLALWGSFTHRFLQPVDNEDFAANVGRCVQIALKDGTWKISGQMHKRLGLS